MKKQFFALMISTAIVSTNPVFGMERETEKVFLEQEELNTLISEADKGDAIKQYTLGIAYREGRVVGGKSDENDKKAVKYLTLAADQGYSHARYFLACMYETGRGVGGTSDENNKEAKKYYKLDSVVTRY